MYDQPFTDDSTEAGSRLDPVLARSWLLVNGSHHDRFEAASRSHADVVVHALSAGLHVLVEKPLCLTLADVDRILAARDRAGTVVQVGYMKRFDPAVERFLGDGLDGLGRLLHVATVTHDPGLARWFGPSPAPPSRPPDLLSDIFLGALVHDVNLVHGLLEAAGRSLPPEARDAFATLDGSAAGGAVELAPGVRWTMAWLRLDGLADFRERVEVYGTGGVAALEFPAPYILHAPTTYVRSTGGEQRRHRSWDEAYARQLRHFHDCVTGRTPCRTPPEQARADIALLTALHARAGEREAVA